ncbi:hypothetical protein M9H77_07691 [Catharanthus roseus]|uniref:Uncharacterized protein n=1 Tax=Catharanthus roseus TaxID=4058 RepID=A0ACC0BVP7_CATRO|nr:hypothetical protein M9H77_07691 [Catharanthus roseus]
MSSTPTPSSLAYLPTPAPSPVPLSEDVVDSHILILPTADSFNKQSDCAKVITEIMKRGIDGTRCVSVPFGTLGIDGPYYDTKTQYKDMMYEGYGGQGPGKHTGEYKSFIEWSLVVTVEHRGGSNSSMSSVPSISSTASHRAYIERKKRLWGYIIAGTGESLTDPPSCSPPLPSPPLPAST